MAPWMNTEKLKAIKADEWCSDLMKYCIKPCKCHTYKKTTLNLQCLIMKKKRINFKINTINKQKLPHTDKSQK